MLPNFLLIGTAKAGTTSLYHYLRQHPDVYMPAVKEPRFFAYADAPPAMVGPGDREANEDSGAVYTLDAYRALFDGVTDEPAVGEASVNYLYSETAPRRIHQHVPNAHLIAILRNPIERAYSHYLHLLRAGREPLRDFEAALAAEPERRRKGWEWSWHYTNMGFYHAQLVRYLEYFDRDQLSVYLFEDFTEDNRAVVQDIYRGLGVDPTFAPRGTLAHAKTGVPISDRFQRFIRNSDHPVRRAARWVLPESLRTTGMKLLQNMNLSKPPMAPAVRERLRNRFEDDIRQLESLLDRDLSQWRAPAASRA
ncbi:MAG: sulfotransferase [Salinibacter sp.]